jgi:hypothetical protein
MKLGFLPNKPTREAGFYWHAFSFQKCPHFQFLERNALRANWVPRAEECQWSSLYRWHHATSEEKRLLSVWPVRRSSSWVDHVNLPQTDKEFSTIQRNFHRGCPFGDASWFAETAKLLEFEITTRPRGRPKFRHIPDSFYSPKQRTVVNHRTTEASSAGAKECAVVGRVAIDQSCVLPRQARQGRGNETHIESESPF